MASLTHHGRRWFITGASRGFGLALAKKVIENGDRAAVFARGSDILDIAQTLGSAAFGYQLDLTQPNQIAEAVSRAHSDLGGIDVVVNNAGLHRGGRLEKLSEADWDEVLATNLSGPFHVVRQLAPLLERDAAIVNVGAVVGFRGFTGDAPYGASKAGLSGLTQVLAAELAPRAIRVNLVVPGFVITKMTEGISDEARARLNARIPLGREGTAEEIADVIYWVAGSTYMTGSTIFTDGGLMMSL